MLVVAAAVLVAVNVAADRARATWDLTAERSATLSQQTLRVLRRLDERVRITAFLPRSAPGRVEAATLLARYRRANRRVSFRIVDPVLAPGESQRLEAPPGSAAVESLGREGKVEIAQAPIEIDLTSAIARLIRETSENVCFTTGRRERAVDDAGPEGLAVAAQLLRDNGYAVTTVDLLTAARPPADCDALVIPAPTEELGGSADGLAAYLRQSGKALVLSDPRATDLSPVTSPWGISFERGIVVEVNADARLPGDPLAPIVRRYSEANPGVRGLGPTFFPGVQGVSVNDPDRAGLSVYAVAETTPTSYLERNLGDGTFDPRTDLEGPVGVGAAADDSEVEGSGGRARIRRTRILAFGDVDFASNAFVREASNARLLIQSVDWLTQPEPLLAAVPNFPKVRELELTEARSDYMLYLTTGVVPALFLIAGAFVWVVRRGR